MKFTASLLALLLVFWSASQAQESAGTSPLSPVLLAQAAPAGSARPAAAAPADTTPAIRTAAAATPASAVNATTLWRVVQEGGWAMYPLGALSILTVMLVFIYLFTLRRSAILTPNYMNTADVLLKKRDYLGLLAISSRHSEVVARVVQRTLDFATKNPNASFEVVRSIAETEGTSQASSLQYRVTYLADIGVLAPMIGLLGTVLGIIRSFGVLGSGTATQSRDILLANGVSEALIATATGLILGIVAMGFYGIFRNRVQSLISDLEIASAHVVGLIALNFNKKREQSRVAVDDEF